MNDQNGILKIYRIPNFFARARSYKILIDGKKADSIKDGETSEVSPPPGLHSVVVKLDWSKSNTMNIKVEPGQIKRLHIGREQIRGKRLIALKGFYVLLILIGAMTGMGELVGVGAAMLIVHRSGKIRCSKDWSKIKATWSKSRNLSTILRQ